VRSTGGACGGVRRERRVWQAGSVRREQRACCLRGLPQPSRSSNRPSPAQHYNSKVSVLDARTVSAPQLAARQRQPAPARRRRRAGHRAQAARTGVQQPAREQRAVRGREREHDRARLAALRLVHRGRPGQLQLPQLRPAVLHAPRLLACRARAHGYVRARTRAGSARPGLGAPQAALAWQRLRDSGVRSAGGSRMQTAIATCATGQMLGSTVRSCQGSHRATGARSLQPRVAPSLTRHQDHAKDRVVPGPRQGRARGAHRASAA